MTMTAPKAPKHPVTRTFHGHEVVDNYEWLRDKDATETREYLEAENAYTEAQTQSLSPLIDDIYGEIKGRVKETDMSVPMRNRGWWYYGRTIEGKDYGISCRVPARDDAPWTPPEVPEDGTPLPGEQVLIDANELATGHDFFSLGAATVSPSGTLLAYSYDTAGDERFTLRIRNLDTGELFDDQLDGIAAGAVWGGNSHLFYMRVDDAWRSYQIWRHALGTDSSLDVLVYEELDERFNVGVGSDRSKRFLYIASSSKTTTEFRVLDFTNPDGEFQLLWPREEGVDYDVDLAVVDGVEKWVVTHNATGPNYAVGVCDVDKLVPLRELDELVSHDESRRVEGTDTYRDFMFLSYRSGGIGRLAVADLGGKAIGEFQQIDFDEELYTVTLLGNAEWDAPVVRMSYTSYTQPGQVLDYTVADGHRQVLKEQEVEGGYNPDDYVAERIWATAEDGTQVPLSVVRRADTDLDAPRPTLLYGYGSYEISMDPYFSVARLSLLDRGMVWACAHVRGGGEMGRLWYDEGKMMKKRNTFTDFIACADELVSRGVTTYDHLVAEGGSAGGLLVGAVANLAPEKFAGILAVVPFVDQLTSILMPELPLTVPEWEEWGDPYHDPKAYDYIASYAPYENVAARDYPDILAVTSLNDTRVLYVEPAKWIAKLRDTATSGTFMLKTEMSAGHGGVSGRYAQWKQTAFEYAWVLRTAGAVER